MVRGNGLEVISASGVPGAFGSKEEGKAEGNPVFIANFFHFGEGRLRDLTFVVEAEDRSKGVGGGGLDDCFAWQSLLGFLGRCFCAFWWVLFMDGRGIFEAGTFWYWVVEEEVTERSLLGGEEKVV